MKATITICFFACLIFSSVTFSNDITRSFTGDLYQSIENKYGAPAKKRATKWQKTISSAKSDNEWKQIHKVNRFFNRVIKEQDDILLWGEKDYWASPLETISKGYGDCEDYAIAKFFSLRALGIPESKLRFLYARQFGSKKPHMVLIYYENTVTPPLVLDNINTKILPLNKRNDLKPIYSFNSDGIWMMRAKDPGKKVKNSAGVSAWRNLLLRIAEGPMPNFGTKP